MRPIVLVTAAWLAASISTGFAATPATEGNVETLPAERVVYAPFTSETPDSEDAKDLILPKLKVEVDLFKQEMKVFVKGELKHLWPVSSGRRGYSTPTGTWRPYRMHTLWRSRKYHGAKMPFAVFYDGGYAIHGTNAVSRLGQPASHGCIRLETVNAKAFFKLVLEHKRSFTEVNLTGEWNAEAEVAFRERRAKTRKQKRAALKKLRKAKKSRSIRKKRKNVVSQRQTNSFRLKRPKRRLASDLR